MKCRRCQKSFTIRGCLMHERTCRHPEPSPQTLRERADEVEARFYLPPVNPVASETCPHGVPIDPRFICLECP